MKVTIDEAIIIGICLYGLGAVSVILAQILWNRWCEVDDDEK